MAMHPCFINKVFCEHEHPVFSCWLGYSPTRAAPLALQKLTYDSLQEKFADSVLNVYGQAKRYSCRPVSGFQFPRPRIPTFLSLC